MNSPAQPAALWLAGLTLVAAGCGGVRSRVHKDVATPRTIAVLPVAGAALPELRDATRALLHSRLASRGYQVPELAWVDRVLAERGWLRDPNRFDAAALPIGPACEALAVDAVALTTKVDESRFNVLILRRHALAADFSIKTRADSTFWSASHTAGSYGGFLLTSGQVFSEFRAQGSHGTPMASLALADELIADVAETLPSRAPEPGPQDPPAVATASVATSTLPDGTFRVFVEATATQHANLQADLPPLAAGVPMVADQRDPQRYRGYHDLAAGENFTHVVVRARDAFGREGQKEVRR
jgi:hypothetical protein